MNNVLAQRAGFWRRIVAVLIDYLLIYVVLITIALLLVGPTGGVVRITDSIISSTNCTDRTVDEVRALGVKLPADFYVREAGDCTTSLFGINHDRVLAAFIEATRPRMTAIRSVTAALDGDGKITSHYLYLDRLVIVVLAVYAILLEAKNGRTLGKLLIGIRVRSLTSAGTPTPGQAIVRFLICFLPYAMIAAILPLLRLIVTYGVFDDVLVIWSFCAVAVVSALVIFINFVMTVSRGRLPWHDRIAGTEVVRDPVASAGSPNRPTHLLTKFL